MGICIVNRTCAPKHINEIGYVYKSAGIKKALHHAEFSFWRMVPELMRSQFALPPTLARLVDSTWPCRHRAEEELV